MFLKMGPKRDGSQKVGAKTCFFNKSYNHANYVDIIIKIKRRLKDVQKYEIFVT